MKEYRAYYFRLYPTLEQQRQISRTFGYVRFVYNYFLSYQKEHGVKKSYDLCKELKNLSKQYVFLKEVDSCALRCAIFHLEDAYKNFFAKRSSYPKYKSKYSYQSYRTNCIRSSYKGKEYNNIELDMIAKTIKLPKLGKVKIRGYRNTKEIKGKVVNATVIKEPTNKYYVSVIVEEERLYQEKVIPKTIVGIDLGIKDLMITSDGKRYEKQKGITKYERRIRRLQKELSRREKESKNYFKTKERLARLYSKLKNSRKHYQNEIANEIVEEHDIIVTEDLKVKEMSKGNRLAKYIFDASFHKICSLLEWKSKKKGKYYYKVNSYYPSSQICCHCGFKNEKIKNLKIRSYGCPRCGFKNDRDINASINIRYEGLKLHYQS